MEFLNMKRSTLLILFVICHQVYSYSILFVFPFGAKSHKSVFNPIAEHLAKNGHQVTLVSNSKPDKEIRGIRTVYIEEADFIMNDGSYSFFDGGTSSPLVLNTVTELCFRVRDATFRNLEFQELWTKPEADRFDLLIIDSTFNQFALPLAHYWGIPVIYISTSIMYTPIAWNLDIPYSWSYLTTGMTSADLQLDFLQRAQNAFFNWGFIMFWNWYLLPNHDRFIQSVFPYTPPLIELERNVSLVMVHTHPSFFPSAPAMPYTVEIACIHCRPGQKLPKDLQEYFDQSGDPGVIYFSLGSYTKGESMPVEMRQKIIAAFAQLPQKILWKFEKNISDLPTNIKLIHWAPQQDILAHPKLRLFITHGGGLSILEASYHGCPIVAFPLSVDQLGNVIHAQSKGFAESLDWNTFKAESLLSKIQQILNDKRYKEKAVLVSRLLRDQPQSPVERAAYWIEYVIRNKGAPHLKSSAGNLNFFQYFLLDVISLLTLIIMSVIGLFYFLIKTCLKLGTKTRNKVKQKQT